MATTILHRCTAWLCLALVLLIGVNPTQGFVVCIEPDGCVSVETKSVEATCVGCEGHEEDASPAATVASASDVSECPCIDLAVPGSSDEQLTRTRAEIQFGAWTAVPPPSAVVVALPLAREVGDARDDVPRVADAWQRLRCVVLRV